MDVEGGEGYTKNTKRKFFGIGGKGEGKNRKIDEEGADKILASKDQAIDKEIDKMDKNASYEKHELLDNENPESWEYDENGKPTELKEAKAVNKLKKEYVENFFTLENALINDELFYDNVHYSEIGHKKISNEIISKIKLLSLN